MPNFNEVTGKQFLDDYNGKQMCIRDSHKCGFGEDTAPDASFTVIGPYENFAKVITGEWDSKTPLVKGKFKLKGNLLAAVAHLGVYQSLIDSKKAVDWDYGM